MTQHSEILENRIESMAFEQDRALDRFARIEVIKVIDGFYPASKPEQVEAMGLEAVIDKPWGTSRHLAEVSRRQIKKAHTDDPQAAVRRITRNYIDWAKDAASSKLELAGIEQEIDYVNPNLGSRIWFDTAETDPTAGMLKFLRFFDLNMLKSTGSVEAVGYDPQKVSYTKDNGGIMYYLDAALERWNVRQLKQSLPAAISHETARAEFWSARLLEVSKHSPPQLKAIALEGLDKLTEIQSV